MADKAIEWAMRIARGTATASDMLVLQQAMLRTLKADSHENLEEAAGLISDWRTRYRHAALMSTTLEMIGRVEPGDNKANRLRQLGRYYRKFFAADLARGGPAGGAHRAMYFFLAEICKGEMPKKSWFYQRLAESAEFQNAPLTLEKVRRTPVANDTNGKGAK